MNPTNKFWWFAFGSIMITAIIIAAVGMIIWQRLSPSEQAVLSVVFKENLIYFFSVTILVMAGIGFGLDAVFHSYILPLIKLKEEAAIIDSANPSHRIRLEGAEPVTALAGLINGWADRMENLKSEVSRRIRQSMADLESERNILATFMAELQEGVIICNARGRVLLYNKKTRTLLQENAADFEGGEPNGLPIGLGRSIYQLFEKSVFINILDEITFKLRSGEESAVAHFVMPGAKGKILLTEVVPILNHLKEFTGFILILHDITQELEANKRVDHLLQVLARRIRSSLASIRSAIETVIEYPQMAQESLGKFRRIIHQESISLGEVVEEAVSDYGKLIERQWPLVAMPVSRFLQTLPSKSLARTGIEIRLSPSGPDHLIRVDSFTLECAVLFLLNMLKAETGRSLFQVKTGEEGAFAHIDLFWEGAPLKIETLRAWEKLTLALGAETLPFFLHEVMRHHGAELWSFASREAAEFACLRIFMPIAGQEQAAREGRQVILQSGRPEFYDFDLFHQPGQKVELDQRPLPDLTYTVFDTETTGLDPRGGDEIIAIGAVRIVNGRLLREEAFHQLVNPGRGLSLESIRIHGLTPDALRGQPSILEVLPRFHRFTQDTVLVGHNVAFDMKMLQMKEDATKVRFINPVLDTLLLSAALHSAQNDHTLEAIASRLGIGIIGRHTALGDAMATAELFLKLLPLLAKNGIHTLKEAREASRQTFYARIRY